MFVCQNSIGSHNLRDVYSIVLAQDGTILHPSIFLKKGNEVRSILYQLFVQHDLHLHSIHRHLTDCASSFPRPVG